MLAKYIEAEGNHESAGVSLRNGKRVVPRMPPGGDTHVTTTTHSSDGSAEVEIQYTKGVVTLGGSWNDSCIVGIRLHCWNLPTGVTLRSLRLSPGDVRNSPSGPFRQSLAYRAERAVSDFVLLSEPAAAVVALGHFKIVVQTLIAPAHDQQGESPLIVSGTRTCAHL